MQIKRLEGTYALILLCGSALAGDIDLSWSAPTGNESCTDAGGELLVGGYRVYQMVADTPDPAYVVTDLTGGEYRFLVTVYNEEGVESGPSNKITKSATALVVITDTVYVMVQQPDRMIFLPVGTILVGTVCDEAQPMGSYFTIPRDFVTWSGTVRPDVVVAACS